MDGSANAYPLRFLLTAMLRRFEWVSRDAEGAPQRQILPVTCRLLTSGEEYHGNIMVSAFCSDDEHEEPNMSSLIRSRFLAKTYKDLQSNGELWKIIIIYFTFRRIALVHVIPGHLKGAVW
jgi:hypothetical protein